MHLENHVHSAFDSSLMSNFLTSLMPPYENRNNLVVPHVKLTYGSVVENILYGFVLQKHINDCPILIPVLHKQWRRHCRLYTSIYNPSDYIT